MKKEYYIIIIVLVFLSGIFYWYEIRPSNIIKECNELTVKSFSLFDEALLGNKYDQRYKIKYEECLRSRGLKK